MSIWHHLQHRLRSLLRRRAFWLLALLFLGGTFTLWSLRLTGVLGYPNALALNLLLGPLSGVLGVMTGRMERVIAGPAQPRWLALYLLPAKDPRRAVLGAWGAAFGAALGLALLGGGVALLGGLVLGRCEILRGLLFYPVLLLPSLALGSVTGVALTLLSERRRLLWPAMVGIAALSLVFTAWPVLFGPQAFVFNHFLGHVPGPIYDERITLTGALLGYRGLTLLWALAIAALAMGFCDAPRFGARSWQRHRGVHALLLASVLGIGTLYGLRHRIGFVQSFASLDDRLGGLTELPGLVIHYPAERAESNPAWLERLRADHAHDRRVLLEWFELDPATAPVVHSYVFRNAAEKAELTGAGATSITKPWLDAIFIHDRPYPHPVLRHELAHALTAPWGRGPFRVSGWPVPNAGLVEGVAVAATYRAHQLTLHEWARAMREAKVAPDIRGLFSAQGFWSESGSRAYTLAGSFIRHLADTEGIGAVRRAYTAGDLAVLGAPEQLFARWEAYLDGLPFDERARRLALDRFRRPSIFRRPCAFDVRALKGEGNAALGRGEHEAARRKFQRCVELEPDDPGHLESLLRVALAGNDDAARAEAERLTAQLLDHPKTGAALATRIHARRGDEAWTFGDLAAAELHYREAFGRAARDDGRRLLSVKRWAISHPAPAETLRAFFLGELSRDLAPLVLHEALESTPEAETEARALFAYLLGRQLFNRQAHARALPYLEAARDQGLPPLEGFALENLRLIALARTELCWRDPTRGPEALAAWEAILAHPGSTPVLRLLAEDRRSRLLHRLPQANFSPPR